MVWMYNGTSSTYMFIDGKKLDLPASLAKRYASILLLEELVMANWQIQMFQNSLWRFSAA
jgi:hypothetical protein